MDLFDFHVATEIATQQANEEFIAQLSEIKEIQHPTRSAVLDSSMYMVENLSKLVTGQIGSSLGSLSGVFLIQGLLSGFSDTRKGMGVNFHIILKDDQKNQGNQEFLMAYRDKFLQSLESISEEPVTPIMKEVTTIFGVKQYTFGGVIKGNACPGSTEQLNQAYIIASDAISGAMNGRAPKTGILKGEKRHYRPEFFQSYNLDWSLPSAAARQTKTGYRPYTLSFRLAERMPGEFFIFIPKSKGSKVGFFYDGERVLPLAFR